MKTQTARTGAVLVLAAACLVLLRGVLPAIAWSALVAVSSWPLHERIGRAFGRRGRSGSAALLTAAAVLALLVPLGWLVWRGVHEVPALLRMWTQSRDAGLPAPAWLVSLPLVGAWALRQWNGWIAQPGGLGDVLHVLLRGLRLHGGRLLLHEVGSAAMTIFFCVLLLFFLYRDGDVLARQIETALARWFGPVGVRTLRLAVEAVRGTVNGLVLVGLAVALLMSLGYAAAGVPHPALWGLLTGLLGMVPFGAALALAGAALWLVVLGAVTPAVVLLACGLLLIFVVDHFVRPAFIAGSSQLPLVLALIGVVAGLETFGVLGIFIGPTLLAVMAAVWRELAAAPGPADGGTAAAGDDGRG